MSKLVLTPFLSSLKCDVIWWESVAKFETHEVFRVTPPLLFQQTLSEWHGANLRGKLYANVGKNS
jgi:hypothetical protein